MDIQVYEQRKTSEIVKVVNHLGESVVAQRKWAVFDLMCGSTWLATYECSKSETEMLLGKASSYQSMLENFTKICEIDRSEMINRWSINLPKQPDQICLSPVDAGNWNEKDIFQC